MIIDHRDYPKPAEIKATVEKLENPGNQDTYEFLVGVAEAINHLEKFSHMLEQAYLQSLRNLDGSLPGENDY